MLQRRNPRGVPRFDNNPEDVHNPYEYRPEESESEQGPRAEEKEAEQVSPLTDDLYGEVARNALAEKNKYSEAESIQYRELHELPADPAEMGPVLDPQLLDDSAVVYPEEGDSSGLQEKIEEILGAEDSPWIGDKKAFSKEPKSEDALERFLPALEPDPEEAGPDVYEAQLERTPVATGKLSAAARSARFAGSDVLPLATKLTMDIKSDIDSTIYALGSFSDIRYGQVGILRVSCRTVPGFKSKGQAWLAAARMGQNIEAKPSVGKKIMSWISYFGSRIAYDINSMSSPKGAQGDPPPSPKNKGRGLKPIPVSQVSPEEKAAWKAAEAKARDQIHFETQIKTVVVGGPEDQAECEQIAETAMSGLEMFNSEFDMQKFVWAPSNPYDALLGLMGAREPEEYNMVLSSEELAAIAHMPDDNTSVDGVQVQRSTFKTMPLPHPLIVRDLAKPEKGVIPLGIQNPNSEEASVVGMHNKDLDRHMLMIGKTGSGKSELMKWLVYGVVNADYPVVLVDPHGQLCGDILKALLVNAPERIKDLVYCDISDSEYPVGFNPLDIKSPDMIEPTVDSVSQMLQVQLNLDSKSSPRATLFAKTAITALCEANLALEDPNTKCTLLDVVPFFTDPEFRQLIVNFSKNLAVQQNFNFERGPFEQMSEKQQSEMTMPINRAFSTLAASESFAAVFSSAQNKLNLGQLITENKIILIQLARFSHQAKLGEFVGALIIPWLLSSMDSWGRKKDPVTGEYTRNAGCRIFVDEAPRVFSADSSVPELLAEARKWDLGLIMAAQFIEQFPRQIIEASLNSTGSKIGLHCDPKAAREISRAVSGATNAVTETDMATMPNFHFYGNVMLRDGGGGLGPSGPFSAKCLPMIDSDLDEGALQIREEVIERSRGLVANPRALIEDSKNSRLENIKIALATKMADQKIEPDFGGVDALSDEAHAEEEGFQWDSGE